MKRMAWSVQDRAVAVVESLEFGDHRDLPVSTRRVIAGIGMMVLGALRPKAHHVLAPQVFVVCNPVAHGVRMANAVISSLDEHDVLADPALSAPELAWTRGTPSLGVRSIGGISTFRRLREAFRGWRTLSSADRQRAGRNALEAFYLYAAQSMRYADAEALLCVPESRARIVITDFDRAAFAAPWIEVARRAGLPTATFVHGSPHAATYLPLRADAVFTWGEAQTEWFRTRAPGARLFEIGRPDLTEHDAHDSGGRRRLFICHSREVLSDGEVAAVRELIENSRDSHLIVMRVHPSVAVDSLDSNWSEIASRCDRVEHGSTPLAAELRSKDLVAVISSTAAIDALALLVRTIVLADTDRDLPADLAAMAAIAQGADQDAGDGVPDSEWAEVRNKIIADRERAAGERLRNALRELTTKAAR